MKQTGTKILIVDDEPAIRFALTEALRSWGYEPFQAATVAEANELFAQEFPGVALLDIDLPDGSGLDVLTTSTAAAGNDRHHDHRKRQCP